MIMPAAVREQDIAKIEAEIERDIDAQLSGEAHNGSMLVEIWPRGTQEDFDRVLEKYRAVGWKVQRGYFANMAYFSKPTSSLFARIVGWFVVPRKDRR